MSDRAAEPPGWVERLTRRPLELLGGVMRGVVRALPRAIEDMFTDRCTQYAAAIAYRVLFSLFPLTIALVSIFGLVLQDDELRQSVIDELIAFLPVTESAQNNVQRSIEEIATPLSAFGLVSLVALLWGASGMMASIRLGLEAALKVERGRPAARAKLVDFMLIAAAGVLVLVIVGLSAFGAFFSKLVSRFTDWADIATPSGLLIDDVIQLLAIGVTVLLLYRFVPARKLRRRGAIAGAVLTAVGIWGATKVLAVVFADFSRYNIIYGSLAGVTTFLFFVYVVAWILLLGAEFAHAWSQPPGPPGPPLRTQIIGVVTGLFIHREEDEEPLPLSEEPARRL
ncbi:MAG TPA: YihY/virulence factor BrkB family protein [Gaiellaceae bacterium]